MKSQLSRVADKIGFLDSFEIDGFKRFKSLKIENLGRINLILGLNNTGKTTILEAIYSFACGFNIRPFFDTVIWREKEFTGAYDFSEKILGSLHQFSKPPFEFSFTAKSNSKSIIVKHRIEPDQIYNNLLPSLAGSSFKEIEQIKNTNSIFEGQLIEKKTAIPVAKWIITINNTQQNQKIYFPYGYDLKVANPLKLGRFVDILEHRKMLSNIQIYSFLKREDLVEEFKMEMKTIFPDIEDIDIIPYPDGTTAPVTIKIANRGNLPIYNFGDGTRRWFNILGGMLLYQNGIHCIEEIDSTFHANAQSELMKRIFQYSTKYNNQVFMTSHSLEFVDNMLSGLEDVIQNDANAVRVITLKNDPQAGQPLVRVLTGAEALSSRNKFDVDLR